MAEMARSNLATITQDVFAQGILEALYHVFQPYGAQPTPAAHPLGVQIPFERHIAKTLVALLLNSNLSGFVI